MWFVVLGNWVESLTLWGEKEKRDFLRKITAIMLYIETKKLHKILVIRLYFLLDILRVSDYISPSSGATL